MNSEAVTDVIAQQEWLEPVETGLQKAVHSAFDAGGQAGRKVEDFLHGTWLGHPLHVVLTDIPIGAWTMAAVLDAADAVRGRNSSGAAADAAVAMGLISAVPTAIAGLTDWHKTDGKSRRVGLVHGLLNITATALFATSWALRRRKSRDAARICGWIGYALAFGSAWLGGDLVYGEKIGVDHANRQPLPSNFVPVMPDADLPEDTPHRAEVNGVKLVLVRRDGRVYALAETCAHLGGPLSEGQLQGESIVCPWHGSRYALDDGRVLDGPSTFPQPCFEARIHNGQIEVRMHSQYIRHELASAQG
ncbi:MAG TPA: Rieske 2Fe-2S domain-containing protein [Chthonomonadaceae bacterium]|nr:Rieske 2Fe-2S domain-containing protein [Chthonomonadaceae bacterium]